MQVTQLAKALATTPDTVRYYTRIGLLNPKRDQSNAYKHYDERDQNRLRFILCARHMGFTVDEISRILDHAQRGDAVSPQITALIEHRLEDINHQLDQTLSLKKMLAAAVGQWRLKPEQAPTGHMLHHLIEAFSRERKDRESDNRETDDR